MKKSYRLGDRPVLLLDEDGSESKLFGIPRNATCVLVYNRSNKLVWAEKGGASAEAVARVLQAVSQLR
jgi:predicted transcriptional regulator